MEAIQPVMRNVRYSYGVRFIYRQASDGVESLEDPSAHLQLYRPFYH